MRGCAVESDALAGCPPSASARVAPSAFTSRVESGVATIALGSEPQPASTATLAANNKRTDLDIMKLCLNATFSVQRALLFGGCASTARDEHPKSNGEVDIARLMAFSD
jgi:hypothetical protein